MGEPAPIEETDDAGAAVRRRRWRRFALGAAALALVAGGFAWFSRERIASDLISGELDRLGLPARYKVASVGLRRQVLTDIVIGDPARPDLTIARVEAQIEPRWGVPAIGRITLVGARLHGTYLHGKLSFGSLDPLLFTGSKAPFRLPDLNLAIRDARALVEGDFGAAAVKLEGEGALRGGFAGTLAAVAPGAVLAGCAADKATLFGALTVTNERPRFSGPLRTAGLACPDRALVLARSDTRLDITLDPALDGGEGKASLEARGLTMADSSLGGLLGTGQFTYRKQALTARYELAASGIDTPQAKAAALKLTGSVRSVGGLARIETEGDIAGTGLALGSGLDFTLARWRDNARGTLAAPLLEQVRAGLLREGRGSALKAAFIVRRIGKTLNIVVPQGSVRGRSGQGLLSLSRLQVLGSAEGGMRIAGNFATGGRGLPRLAGRMERPAGGQLSMRLHMVDYAAGDARLGVPHLTVAQARDGSLGFAGLVNVSGAFPGGQARGLVLPVDGNWSARRGLSLWRQCIDMRFDRLALAGLTLERRRLPLCPARGTAIVRIDGAGTRIAAGAPALDLAGRLGSTPIRIASGPVGFAMPGMVSARRVQVALGPADTASRFTIAALSARAGRDIAGTFSGADVALAAVPLDVLGAGGAWRYANGRLAITDAAFRLEDRARDDRFQPLLAQGAALLLAGNAITAEAPLREPGSGREVVRAAIGHDLSTGGGHADLTVAGILFDKALQPDTLTRQALGVIANAEGTVRGGGRIDWNPERVTSSGRFVTDGMDFAAAFGQVRGASGEIVFTDLLGLVTAPGQELRIASMNPGIEVVDGRIRYALEPGSVLQVNGGEWPFLGGRLELLPVRMNLGIAEVRRYTLAIEGLDAAKLAEQMNLGNISVSGTFDGVMPLVFDENGGRIEKGLLKSRPGGGNLSYVGALTYKDLSAMANFAFDALRSIDYRDMRVEMDGSLEGEIITRVMFDGVRQGTGARRNFVTRQIAKLPIRFNLNIKAAFFQLVSSLRSIYDPAYLRDPRSLGLMDDKGNRLVAKPGVLPAPGATSPDIQQPASGTMP